MSGILPSLDLVVPRPTTRPGTPGDVGRPGSSAAVGGTYRPSLDVAGRRVVVFGSGGHAVAEVAALREARAEVLVVCPRLSAALVDLVDRGCVAWAAREAEPGDLDEAWLAVADTGDDVLDDRIAGWSAHRRVWCVVAGPRARASQDRRDGAGDGAGARTGGVVLVGGGPGDPGLLTAAACAALRDADVVVADRLGPVSALVELAPDAEIIDVGKVPFGPATSQDDINGLLVSNARAGRRVVRLKGGDSFLFGRGGEEREACLAAGVELSVVPGVTSAFAVPASAGIPVTHRGLVQGVTVVSGHVAPGDPRSTVNYAALAACGTTIVLLMAVRTLADICEELIVHGMHPDTPAATVADGTLVSQRVVRATLQTLAAAVAGADIKAPAVTVIGDVAALGEPGSSA